MTLFESSLTADALVKTRARWNMVALTQGDWGLCACGIFGQEGYTM